MIIRYVTRLSNNLTKVSRAKPETVSVRTTIPSHIAEKLNLDVGDVLKWDMDKNSDGQWCATVIRNEQAFHKTKSAKGGIKTGS